MNLTLTGAVPLAEGAVPMLQENSLPYWEEMDPPLKRFIKKLIYFACAATIVYVIQRWP